MPSQPVRVRVLIIADVRLYREGLASGLSSSPRLEVIETCGRAQGRERARQVRPDVVLVDVAATYEGLDLIRGLRSDTPDCKILAFAVEEEAADIIECAEAGAAGYVTADASMQDLIAAIERAARAELLCSPRIAAELFGRISTGRERPSVESKMLTTRERQVLECIRVGHSNKEIAQKLNIAETTVKNHVHHLLEKLGVTSRAQAAARATLTSSRRGAQRNAG